MTSRLLVIDDDESNCLLVRAIFRKEGLEVLFAHDGPTGLASVATHDPDVVLLDLRLPGIDGLDVLKRLKEIAPSLPVIMLTGSLEIKHAVRATQLGAFDYLTKPIDTAELAIVVHRARETMALRKEVEVLRRNIGRGASDALVEQMGSSHYIEQLVEQVGVVAESKLTVLVLGETGTGKELIAQAIHQQSARRQRTFTALDCGAIPDALLESELFGHEKGAFTGAERRKEGRFRLAQGGTCFLDEVGNLPIGLQAKLLRVLESGEIQPVGSDRTTRMDVRFIAATNHDLQARIGRGEFRSDLYYRLAQYTISVPPLRERLEDLEHLANRFLNEATVELRRPVETMVPEALAVLRAHDWPGNVRELRNVIRQAVLRTSDLALRPKDVMAAMSQPALVPSSTPAIVPGQPLRATAEQAARAAERSAITDALRATDGNKSQAAKMLQTDYKTLHVKIKQLGINVKDFGR
jgi:DNA-binding NtrC family response regulator